MERFYLDTNATYGILPEVASALASYGSSAGSFTYQNASAVHLEGQKARAEIDKVRDLTAKAFSVNQHDYHLVFNSGASEGNATAIETAISHGVLHRKILKPHIITTTIEHSSILDKLIFLEKQGRVSVSRINPGVTFNNESEQEFISNICSAITPETCLVSVMWANNESGRILPVPALFNKLNSLNPKVLLHSDSVQVAGKLPINNATFPYDFLTFSAHKFGAMCGVGVMVVNKRVEAAPLISGGSQENRWRAGTENLIGIATLKDALYKLQLDSKESEASSIAHIRDAFEEELLGRFSSLTVIDKDFPRLPNTTLLHFNGMRGDDLVVALDLAGVACSTGAACSSGKQLGSTVLRGLGFPAEWSDQVVRFSFPLDFPLEKLKLLIDTVSKVIGRVPQPLPEAVTYF
jgi:cysteine desulfurase